MRFHDKERSVNTALLVQNRGPLHTFTYLLCVVFVYSDMHTCTGQLPLLENVAYFQCGQRWQHSANLRATPLNFTGVYILVGPGALSAQCTGPSITYRCCSLLHKVSLMVDIMVYFCYDFLLSRILQGMLINSQACFEKANGFRGKVSNWFLYKPILLFLCNRFLHPPSMPTPCIILVNSL